MRRSNSQFKRSSLSKFSKKQVLTSTATLSAVVFIFSTCRTRPTESTSAVKNEAPLITVNDDVSPTWIPLRDGSERNTPIIAWLGARSCIDSTLTIKSNLVTAINTTELVVQQAWDGSSSEIKVDTANITTPTVVLSPAQKQGLCAAVQAKPLGAVLTADLSGPLKAGVERTIAAISPDCSNVEATTEGWRCSLKTIMPQSAIVQVEDLQVAMIKRWSRQPYIIARKAGVTMSLAKIANNFATDDSLGKFCKLLQFSLPEELPLVMTSPSWQKALCDGEEKNRRELSFHGLAKAVEELSILRQLYENTSKVGVFSVRIPDKDIPGRAAGGPQPFRILISPEQEVTDHLVEVASTLLGRPMNSSGRRLRHTASTAVAAPIAIARKPSCWHPVFSDTPALLRVAEGMRLTGDGFKGECKTEKAATAGSQEALAKYLMQSLASESEFVMDNGQSKLLRMPEGNYKYTVQVLPQNPIDAEESAEDSAPETHGDIIWGTAKNHAIRSW